MKIAIIRTLVAMVVLCAAFAATMLSPHRPPPRSSVARGSSLDDDLVAYYPFDGNAEDFSGRGNSGSLVGPIATTDRNGRAGAALQFDGVDDFIEIPPVVSTDAFSVSLWVRAPRTPAACIVHQGLREWSFGTDENAKICFGVKFADGHWSYTRAEVSPGTWTHLVGVYKKGEFVKLYVNEALVDSIQPPPANNLNNTLYRSSIGAALGGTVNFFAGSLDDLRIYAHTLSRAEIHALRNED